MIIRSPSKAGKLLGDGPVTRLILASASPRRLEILRSLGLHPEVRPSDVPEVMRRGEPPAALVQRLAQDKVLAALRRLEGAPRTSERIPRPAALLAKGGSPAILVLGADTAVAVDGEIFGKPRDPAEASRMLSRLSGRAHEVFTGLALGTGEGARCEHGVAVTRVVFAPLTREKIEAYVATGEPMDKAGAYAIQSGAQHFVEGFEGSYTNVVGLPVELFETLLARIGVSIADLRS